MKTQNLRDCSIKVLRYEAKFENTAKQTDEAAQDRAKAGAQGRSEEIRCRDGHTQGPEAIEPHRLSSEPIASFLQAALWRFVAAICKLARSSRHWIDGQRSSQLNQELSAMAKKKKRTVLYSSAGKKLYAVRDAKGEFVDIRVIGPRLRMSGRRARPSWRRRPRRRRQRRRPRRRSPRRRRNRPNVASSRGLSLRRSQRQRDCDLAGSTPSGSMRP